MWCGGKFETTISLLRVQCATCPEATGTCFPPDQYQSNVLALLHASRANISASPRYIFMYT